jgi:hypothetical protein
MKICKVPISQRDRDLGDLEDTAVDRVRYTIWVAELQRRPLGWQRRLENRNLRWIL